VHRFVHVEWCVGAMMVMVGVVVHSEHGCLVCVIVVAAAVGVTIHARARL